MKLKVFKLRDGKLEYVGVREVRAGDIIVEGQTSMAETVHLREARIEDLNREILAGLSGKEKEDFERGLHNMGMTNPDDRDALRAAFKRLRPDATERELDIMVSGKASQEGKSGWSL